MGFLDKAKAAAEQAAAKAKEGADQVQTQRAIGQSYSELGKTTFELVESGEISHPRLTETVDKLKALLAKHASDGSVDGAADEVADEVDSSQPPAMPS